LPTSGRDRKIAAKATICKQADYTIEARPETELFPRSAARLSGRPRTRHQLRQRAHRQALDSDFAKMTDAMGGRGIRIEHPDQFGDAYREAIRSSTPTVIEVLINRDTGIPITGTWQMPPIPEVQPTFGQRKVR
jgi:TPP-dependent trihydroxycyclohexane-1,2-dione (THcHDO) dehydratase